MIVYFLVIAGLLIWGGALAWHWKSVRDLSSEVLAVKQSDGEVPDSVTEAEFADLYLRSEGPRAQTYIFICAAALFFLLGPFVAGFNAVWNTFWLMSGKSPVFETGTLIHTFMVFLAFMGTTIAVLAAAMHRYYALMPPNLKQVIRDLNGGAR